MKAIVVPNLLMKELKKISPVVGQNQVFPALACVRMDFENKVLKVTGTNLNTWVTYSLPCDHKTNFSILVNLVSLMKICSKAKGPIVIDSGEKIHKFSYDESVIKEPVSANIDEFANVEDVEYQETFEVDGSFFHALSGAAVCMLKDATRPHLSAIGLDFKKDSLTVIGVDGTVMHKQDFDVKVKKPILIAANSMFADITKSFQDSKISICPKFIKAEYDGAVVVSRLSESRYVDYSPLLRDFKNEWNLTVNRQDLLNSIDTVDFATKVVLFTLTPGEIDLFAEDKTIERQATSRLSARHDLEMKFMLDGKILTSLLNTISDEYICFGIKSPKDNVFIKPEDNDSVLLAIMPLFYNDLNQ